MSLAEKQEFDVIVVGGGVIGLSIARELCKQGVERVAILERNSDCGAEASRAAAGMLAPQAEANKADDFFRLCQQSRDFYKEFARELLAESGTSIELEQTGTLYLAFNKADLSKLENRFDWQTAADLPIEKLTAKQILELEPNVSPNVAGGLRFGFDWQVNTSKLIESLKRNLSSCKPNNSAHGAEFINQTVESVRFDDNKRIVVQTNIGEFYASSVVVAAGAWSSFLDLPGDLKIEVEPIRGQILRFQHKALFRHVIYSPRGYVVPRLDSEILVGATVEKAGFEQFPTGAGVSSLLQTAFEISEHFQNLNFSRVLVGLRPKTPDGLPLLGEYPENSGLYFATGHYRNGILLAPLTAKIIADKIVNKIDSPFLKTFNPSRFVNKT